MTGVVGIINPARRHATAVRETLIQQCRAAGWPEPEIVHTTVAEPGRAQAQWAVERGAQRVVVVGGDGTVRQVAAGLKSTQAVLGIIPTGTANLFALNLGLAATRVTGRTWVQRAVHRALHEAPQLHDVPELTWRIHPTAEPGAQGTAAGRVQRPRVNTAVSKDARQQTTWQSQSFLAAAGVGHHATAVAETSEATKGKLGWMAYLRTGARHLAATAQDYTLSVDGAASRHVTAWSVLWGNTSRIPAGISVFPEADPQNGHLEMLLSTPARLTDWAGVAFHGLRGKAKDARALTYRTVDSAVLRTPCPVALQVDGDFLGLTTEVHVRVEPRCLWVAVPAQQRPHPSPGPPPVHHTQHSN
ncbi:diacylglycerol/lipid kinase family protein [Kocuria sp.]|uniref:diacylglycerol/lipid kinase family protein n=1 Tax=Kocuria sp. TaxID=1871328 RepID=UPI0026DF176A|nr:diacylglycerol kinase family protein [Kocuria sp.]MDO5617215.1 diacylglycerol kinase family protein [Kocuria sp.]